MEKRRGGGGEGEAGWLGTKGGWLKVGGGRFQNIFWAQMVLPMGKIWLPKYILKAKIFRVTFPKPKYKAKIYFGCFVS